MRYILVFVLVLVLGPLAAAQNLTIVKNGKSDWAVAVAPPAGTANNPAVMHGAEELQRFFEEMSGAKLPIVDAREHWTPLPRAVRGLVVVQDSGASMPEEALRVTAGRFRYDRRSYPAIIVTGGGKRGTLYGCYALLEDVLGCRWFLPNVSRIPKHATITVPGKLALSQKPAFEYREPYYWEAFDKDWAVRNRTNGNHPPLDASVGGKVSYGRFVHTFAELVPPEQYFDSHPEYFSEINGKRMKGYYQLCLTNPDVLKISIEKVRQWIRENPTATIFSVSQNDTYNNCQCAKCKAVDAEEGAPSGLLLRFVNAVADAVAKESPNVLIDTLAYQWTEAPPKITRPRPNVRIRLAPIGACFAHPIDKCDRNAKVLANLQSWGKITHQLYVWHYSTNFANYLQPLPDLDEIAADVKLFQQNGTVGIFYEGSYAAGGGGEMAGLKSYLIAKLMWNPDRPAQPIIDEYLDGVYGKAAPFIRQWLALLHQPAREKGVHAGIYDPPTAPYLATDTLAAGDKLFDQAEAAAQSDSVALDQVQRARLALEYVELMRMPATEAGRAELAKRVAGKIRKYGITEAREGQPISAFLARIGQQ